MTEVKVKYEHLVEEMTIHFGDLKNCITSSVNEIKSVFANLDDSMETSSDSSDYSAEIKKKYRAGEPLKGVHLKFYWSNFRSFEVGMIDWCLKTSSISKILIERHIIRSWKPILNSEELKYETLERSLGKPELISQWRVLDDFGKITEFSEDVVPKYLSGTNEMPHFLLKTLLFRYAVADFCYRKLSLQELIDFKNTILETPLRGLHYDDMIKAQSFDIPAKLMIATLLKSFRQGKPENDQVFVWLNTLKSILGDPRALGNRWGMIEELEPEGYANWLSSLNEEDILFFFENLENVIHPERREFWLGFVKRAKRIAMVLDVVQRRKLLKKYQHNDKMLDIINRSYQFNSNMASDQQLIIYFFNGYVFVEGSNTGFACQVYEESFFKKKFEAFYYARKEGEFVIPQPTYNPFRGAGSGVLKGLSHLPLSPAWEQKFLNNFSQFGIFPDSARQMQSRPAIKPSESKYVAVTNDASPKNGSSSNDLLNENERLNLVLVELKKITHGIIDNRPKGPVWVMYDPMLKPAMESIKGAGFKVRLAQNGSKATRGMMAWYIEV